MSYIFWRDENRFSGHPIKMRLRPKSGNVITRLASFNAILGQPRAKINASRLHYTTVRLMDIAPVSTMAAHHCQSAAIANRSGSSLVIYTMHYASDIVTLATLIIGNAGRDTGKASLVSIAQRTA
jgi:hypothetical protein